MPHIPRFQSRRDFLFQAGGGFGALALTGLLQREGLLASEPQKPAAGPFAAKVAHFPAKAERVLFLFMEGGPSHIDLFDPKPELTRLNGQKLPPSFGPVMTPTGRVYFAFDPKNPANTQIVDLGLAPRNSRGEVEAVSEFVMLRPGLCRRHVRDGHRALAERARSRVRGSRRRRSGRHLREHRRLRSRRRVLSRAVQEPGT